ncbi:sensor histidine kinase [Aquibacillus salsiterrae]|uniref:histidine kinase n=1 Tax=Aquibacillus salsiterrae TaxID=2950439 RepID=A0A9X4AE15_9BACI|nr:sensor histidine kinase [Aquibacillus salsiterrae]MDC3415959.1 sensor histidine kinase [Aquibacillus salsiterrae]
MQNWFHIFPKNTGLSFYIWLIFCILPFYFIFRSSSKTEIIIGILMTILFFTSYRLSFLSKGWPVYLWVSIDIGISLAMTWLFGYIYFSLFLAFFIGNIHNKAGFITLYIIHLITTITAIIIGFFMHLDIYFSQIPFIVICLIGVILLPFTMFNRIKQDQLEHQLQDANEQISELMVLAERQRIARDLHDTLGQKLSLIGLKSDLATKLMVAKPTAAKSELADIQATARMALKEVREMVSDMRGTRIKEEIIHVKEILKAAQINLHLSGTVELNQTPLFVEHVLSMCLKEAVTNIVKHSEANDCYVHIEQNPKEVIIEVRDNGVGVERKKKSDGHGLEGMQERIDFVNGNLKFDSSDEGTILTIQVPNVIK